MNDLERFFEQNTGRQIHKWDHYFKIYDRHFARFRNKAPVVVEFGVSQGGSLKMWKEYFGPGTTLIGVDINEKCKGFEEDGVRVVIGDQSDRGFLRQFAKSLPPIDVLIEDGGHTMVQQIVTFEEMFPAVAPTGVYLCEDLHTSYWKYWGGGYKRRDSFIEYSKNWIDDIHAWHSREPKKLAVSDFTRSVDSVHFYDSIVVIEKQPREAPADRVTGSASIPDYIPPPRNVLQRLSRKLRKARSG
jgi:hypothetical protein